MSENGDGLIPKERLIRRIGSAYEGKAAEIVNVLRGLDPSHFDLTAQAVAMHHVREIVAGLDAEAGAWAESSIKSAYDEGKAVARVKLNAIGARRSGKYDPARHDRAIAGVVKSASRDYQKANQTIVGVAGKYMAALTYARKKVDSYHEEVDLQAFTSAEARVLIDELIEQATEEHTPALSVGRMIMDRLIGLLNGADIININGRNYDLRSYSEMVARTRMREAQTEATKELCKEYGNDLVQFSDHDNACDECAQYEGVIFSLSGESTEYDVLPDEAEPPVHPNCEHNLNPVSENEIAARES